MGMNTRHPRAELLALADGRLSPAARALVEQHLAGCAACRAEAAHLFDMADTLSALPAAMRPLTALPADSWAHVWARVQGVPIRRVFPQLNLVVTLPAVFFLVPPPLPPGLSTPPFP